MLDQLTVRQKLLAGFGLLILLLLGVVAAALWNMASIQRSLEDVTNNRYPRIVLVNKVVVATLDVGRGVRNAVIASSPEQIAADIAAVDKRRAEIDAHLAELDKILNLPRGRELLGKIQQQHAVLNTQFEPLYALLRANKDAEAGAFIRQKFAPANNAFMAALNELTAFQEELMQQAIEHGAAAYQQAETVMYGSAALALVIGLSAALWIAQRVTAPLQRSAQLVQQIKQGDLSGRDEALPPSRDEAITIARDIQHMRQGLREVVANILQDAQSVSNAARELASMSEEVAGGAQRQSEATTSAAATIEQLTVSINHVADNASQASDQARAAGELASGGGRKVQASVGQINVVTQSVENTSGQMRSLTDEVQRIGNIVTVIRDVAEQTNLLALNAAIEAARAGEMGRGFAVVADEVRKLAERTTSSAQEITQMIGAIQQNAHRVVNSMEGSLSSVGTVSEHAHQASEAMQEIEGNTVAIVGTIGSISSSLTEQRSASLTLAQSMEQVSQMAEQNSATVEELATTSGQLNALAQSLMQVTARFRL